VDVTAPASVADKSGDWLGVCSGDKTGLRMLSLSKSSEDGVPLQLIIRKSIGDGEGLNPTLTVDQAKSWSSKMKKAWQELKRETRTWKSLQYYEASFFRVASIFC